MYYILHYIHLVILLSLCYNTITKEIHKIKHLICGAWTQRVRAHDHRGKKRINRQAGTVLER